MPSFLAKIDKGVTPFWDETTKSLSDQRTIDENELVSDKMKLSWLNCERQGWYTSLNMPPLTNCTIEGESSTLKTQIIKLKPDAKQKDILSGWVGTSRFVYNKTIEFFNERDKSRYASIHIDWKEVVKRLWDKKGIPIFPKWVKLTPRIIVDQAIRDACIAVGNAKMKRIQTKKNHRASFRTKKDMSTSLYIPKTAVIPCGFYITYLGSIRSKTPIPPVDHDCRLVFHRENGYSLHIQVPMDYFPKEDREWNRRKIVSLDPGVRTFLTGFSESEVIEIGKGDISRVFRLRYVKDVDAVPLYVALSPSR